jgi:hypothetical protein
LQPDPNGFNLFNANDLDSHRTNRKRVGAAVSERSARAFDPTLSGQVDIFAVIFIRSDQNDRAK